MSWRKVGGRIKELRERQGMSQSALAKRAGISRIYVAKLEAGEKTNPSFDALDRIARALRAKLMVDLIRRED